MWLPVLFPPISIAPPPTGTLPHGGGVLSDGENPYQVYFTDSDGNYVGFEGVLLSDLSTVLTSAFAASVMGGSITKYRAVMGTNVSTLDGPNAQVAECYGALQHEDWVDPDYGTDLGLITTSGFFVDAYVNYIEYSASQDTVPYPGDYFYPVGTNVVWSSLLENEPTVTIMPDAEGVEGVTTPLAYAEALLGFSLNEKTIPVEASEYMGAHGSGLIVAGYGSYFCAGILSRKATGLDGITLFTNLAFKSGWVEFNSGISPIIYP